MKDIYFASIKSSIEKRNGKKFFKADSCSGEYCNLLEVPIDECVVIKNSKTSLIIEHKNKTFAFQFDDYVPMLKKVVFTIKLFRFIPAFRTEGEISLTDQKQLSNLFSNNVNKYTKTYSHE